MTFPRDFVWGAATAAYQIEGAATEDGRGESIWDRFCRTPGNVANGDNGDVACDHYHRWPRGHRPDGRARPQRLPLLDRLAAHPAGRARRGEPAGLDFYGRLVDGLLERGIAPFATLYHWDLPQRLQDDGGWASREIVDRFVDYAEVVFERSRRPRRRLDHPQRALVTSFLGYGDGVHAPGVATGHGARRGAPPAALARPRGARLPRRWRPRRGRHHAQPDAVTGEPEAARRLDGHRNRWFLDPVLRGGYPADLVELYEDRIGPLEFVQPGDLETIAAPIDFLGINYYQPAVVRPSSADGPLALEHVPCDGAPTMGWEVEPASLTALLLRLKRDYGEVPLLITENGAAYDDRRSTGRR